MTINIQIKKTNTQKYENWFTQDANIAYKPCCNILSISKVWKKKSYNIFFSKSLNYYDELCTIFYELNNYE